MKVVFCSAEVAPFSQAGGLGDVAGSLPKALDALPDVEATVITPMYGMIDTEARNLELTDIAFTLLDYDWTWNFKVWKGTLPNSDVPIYFIDHYELFGYRKAVYPYGEAEWEQQGFFLFSRACLELLRRLNLRPDVLHVHDWHTCPIITELRRQPDDFFAFSKTVLTIHNLNYQGTFGNWNWLREGIWQSDAVTTVSPNYAREIQTVEFGAGLDGVMREQGAKVSGILNGIDTGSYNPASDAFITKQYDAKSFEKGKALCKEALQVELGLPKKPDVPLVGFVGRLTEQKGVDILLEAMYQLHGENLQFALLGSGDPASETALKALNSDSENMRSFIGFNTAMAMRIYAGCDMFVMPSRFEPCGLGQLISLRYGSVPVVRGVGGLVDTVFDLRADAEKGNGFVFYDYSAQALKDSILAAAGTYADKKAWKALVTRGMQEDNSWGASAKAYRDLYGQLTLQPARV